MYLLNDYKAYSKNSKNNPYKNYYVTNKKSQIVQYRFKKLLTRTGVSKLFFYKAPLKKFKSWPLQQNSSKNHP